MATRFFAAIAVIPFLFSLALAQAGEIAKIDAIQRNVERMAKLRPDLIFADVAGESSTAGDWKKFSSEKALEAHRETSETYSIAYAWRSGGKVAGVTFTLFSPSGDWTKYVHSYYRPDGSLAKSKVDYRTFYGDLIVEQDIYFNKAGKVIKQRDRVLDLTTHKPKKIGPDMREHVASMKKEIDHHMSTSKLPFAKLIK